MEPLSRYLQLCHSVSSEQFIAQYPDPWMVLTLPGDDELLWRASPTTDIVASTEENAMLCVPECVHQYAVLRVRHRPELPHKDYITLGRSEDNDLILRAGSVSKLHAHFTPCVTGSFTLMDAGSRNGTTLNTEAIRGNDARPVCCGDRVQFGLVHGTYYDTRGFYDYVQQLLQQAEPT